MKKIVLIAPRGAEELFIEWGLALVEESKSQKVTILLPSRQKISGLYAERLSTWSLKGDLLLLEFDNGRQGFNKQCNKPIAANSFLASVDQLNLSRPFPKLDIPKHGFFADVEGINRHNSIYLEVTELLQKNFDNGKDVVFFSYGITESHQLAAFDLAEKHNQKFFVLSHSKISNRMVFLDGISGKPLWDDHSPDATLTQGEYDENKKREISDSLNSSLMRTYEYEGQKKFSSQIFGSISQKLRLLKFYIKEYREYRNFGWGQSYISLYLHFLILALVIQPYRRFVSRLMSQKVNLQKFVLISLHAEPEVGLSLYSTETSNQVEFVRLCRQFINLKFHIVVKDHPRNFGTRSIQSMKFLSSLPNVTYINDGMSDGLELLHQSFCLVTIGGSISQVAGLSNIPVKLFGQSLLADDKRFPNVERLERFSQLSFVNVDSSSRRKISKEELNQWIEELIASSVSLDWMTVLLGKDGRVWPKDVRPRNQQLTALARFTFWAVKKCS